MASQKVNFQNQEGLTLSARLELPVNQHPHTYALFAHCFTCNKNLTAVRNISRALNLNGIAVLRFDFTGLGESDGEFADTNFSSNVSDLIAAAKFLEDNYKSPAMLVGHSLGGAAVINAASQLPNVKVVATIGAPAESRNARTSLSHPWPLWSTTTKTARTTHQVGNHRTTHANKKQNK